MTAQPPGRRAERERPQGNAPVCDVVQRKRAGDAIERLGLQRQWLGEVGDQEPAAPAAAALGFLDHPGADVDGDDIGALFQQPLRLRSGSAAGIQHCGTVQVAGN